MVAAGADASLSSVGRSLDFSAVPDDDISALTLTHHTVTDYSTGSNTQHRQSSSVFLQSQPQQNQQWQHVESKVLQRKPQVSYDKLRQLKLEQVGLVGRQEELQQIQTALESVLLDQGDRGGGGGGGREDATKHDEGNTGNGNTKEEQEQQQQDYQRAILTIQGPSGVGKTRLAQKALQNFQRNLSHGRRLRRHPDASSSSNTMPSESETSSSLPQQQQNQQQQSSQNQQQQSSPMSLLVGQGKWSLTDTKEPLAGVKQALHQIAQQICQYQEDEEDHDSKNDSHSQNNSQNNKNNDNNHNNQRKNPFANLRQELLQLFPPEDSPVLQVWMPCLLRPRHQKKKPTPNANGTTTDPDNEDDENDHDAKTNDDTKDIVMMMDETSTTNDMVSSNTSMTQTLDQLYYATSLLLSTILNHQPHSHEQEQEQEQEDKLEKEKEQANDNPDNNNNNNNKSQQDTPPSNKNSIMVALLMDDAQWADPASLQLLLSWARDPALQRLAILLCHRSNDDNSSSDNDNNTDEQEETVPLETLNQELLQPLQAEAAASSNTLLIRDIDVRPWTLEQTHSFVTELLQRHDDVGGETWDLSQLLQKKTNGSPFYVTSILQDWQAQGLLHFDVASGFQWKWDYSNIQAATLAAPNVVQLVEQRLMRSGHATRSLLPVAALLGASFSTTVLMQLLIALKREEQRAVNNSSSNNSSVDNTTSQQEPTDKTNEVQNQKLEEPSSTLQAMGLVSLPKRAEVPKLLQQCCEDGFLDRMENAADPYASSMYRFVHDKIQEAALRMLGSNHLEHLQWRIGKILLQEVLASQDDDPSHNVSSFFAFNTDYLVFTTVSLLNQQIADQGTSLLDKDDMRSKLVRLNYDAGNRAMNNGSFTTASRHYDIGIELFGRDGWVSMRKLCIKLHSKRAWAAYSAGEDEESVTRKCQPLLERTDVTLLDKAEVYFVQMTAALGAGDNKLAFEHAFDFAQQLGIKFPKNAVSKTVKTIIGLLNTKGLARRLSVEDVQALPLADDPKEKIIIQTLDRLTTYSFVAKPDLIPLVIVEIIQRTMKYGLTEYSCCAFSLFGILAAGVLEDYQTTKICYDLSRSLHKRIPSKNVEARLNFVNAAYLQSWFSPQQNTIRPLVLSYRQGLLSGDLESAAWGVFFHIVHSENTGRPLDLIESDCESYCEQMDRFGMLDMAQRATKFHRQAMRIFIGSDRSNNGRTAVLGGDLFDHVTELKQFLERNDLTGRLGFFRSEVWLATFMGNYERAADKSIEDVEEAVKVLPGHVENCRLRFHAGFCGLVMAQRSNVGRVKRKQYEDLGMRNAKAIRKWTAKGVPNILHFDTLLDAEKARLRGKPQDAMKAYESAIVLAGRQGFIQDQALAYERYADLLFSLGEDQEGEERFNNAILKYTEWAAMSKVSILLEGRKDRGGGGYGKSITTGGQKSRCKH